jgi:N-acetylneuraminic acid mutarotase
LQEFAKARIVDTSRTESLSGVGAGALQPVITAQRFFAVVVTAVLGAFALAPSFSSSANPSSANVGASTTSTSLPARQPDSDLDGLTDADDPCPNDARNACFGPVAIDETSGNPIRLTAAPTSTPSCANAQIDCHGEVWLAQFGARGASTGALTPTRRLERLGEILDCDDDATQSVFRCAQRPQSTHSPLVYVFDVEPGTYVLNLYFAASASRQLKRRHAGGVSIVVNDIERYSGFDPADVSAAGTLVVRSIVTQAEHEGLRVELHSVRRRTALRALEVLAEATTSTTSVSSCLPAGSGAIANAVVGDDDNDGLLNASDPCPTEARNRCAGSVARDTSGKALRINANVSSAECSGAKTDCNGDTWAADFGYNQSGKASTCNLNGGGESCAIAGISAIFGCTSESTGDLFQCDHYDIPGTPELVYQWPISNGAYVVNLFFANTSTKTTIAGKCVFDIRIEDATVYPNFDQVVAAGGSGTAVVRSAVVNVADGNLRVELIHKTDNPAIKAIEVLSYAPPECTGNADCNDANPCTTDACVAGNCTHTNNSATCASDGNSCTNDVCNAGTCTHSNNTAACADDGNVCTNDVCNAGACTHPSNTAVCADDGDACTSDVCNAGTCTHPPANVCADDGNPCTDDVCSAGACTHPAISGSCTDDGNPCTGDVCSGGICTHPAVAGACASDGNPCTGDVCSGGACTHPVVAGACASDGNPCTDDVCSAGACTHPANTASCNDGVACTSNDACSGGTCAGTSNCAAGQTCSTQTGQCIASGGDTDNDGLTGTDPCPDDPRNLCAGPVATDTASGKQIRLNANVSTAECSGTKTDCNGAIWLGDFGYNQSAKASTCNLNGGGEACVISGITDIFGCDDESTEDLFQCEHSDVATAPELIYAFTVPNARYLVNLFFANTYTGTTTAGTRTFDIRIEGATVYSNFDQVVAAGGSGRAVVRSAIVDVADGNGLQIEFVRRVENPTIKAIEILLYGTASCTNSAQCDDADVCTTDACTSGTCINTPNTLACNDGIACTANDVCSNGTCHGTSACPAGQTCNSATGSCEGTQTCADSDGDGACNTSDPCPHDGLDDADNDGICAGASFNAPKSGAGDNCPATANAGQTNSDGDGRGDACDACPLATGAAEDACLGTGSWSSRAPSTILRHEGGMTSFAGKNYLIGSDETLTTEIYDPATNTWTTGVSVPSERQHIQPLVVNGKIYLVGGLSAFPGPSLNTVLVFDPANPGAGWQSRAQMPTSRGAMGCALDGVKIYCAGGLSSTAGNTAINAMEVYNTATNTWATLAPMPHDRDHFQAAIIDGKFYAVSGRDTAIANTFGFTDVYDIQANTWTSGAPLPTPRGGYASAVVQGRFIVISGEGNGPVSGLFPNVDEYDPARNVWRALASIPTPLHGSGVALNSAPDGVERIYVTTGGITQGGSHSNVNQAFRY